MPTIDLNGTKIAYRRGGAGEPVVLLHSSTGSSAQWKALFEDLQEDFLVLAPDLYGYGESDGWPGTRPLTLADEAAIVEALARTCDGPIHLIGHSYGGAVALKAAIRGKVALRSLSLIEPVAFHVLGNSDPWGDQYLNPVREVADFVRSALTRGNPDTAMCRFVDFWSGAGTWDSLPPKQREKIAAVAPKVPLDFGAAMAETLTLKDICTLGAPSLLMCGTVSPPATRRIVSLLDLALGRSRLNVVSGAGHMLPLTHAEPVNRAIVEHLQRHRAVVRLAA